MSDTPRMDAAFNQPTSTTPRMNWQLDQCYREGCKLERELAEARTFAVCTHGTTTASAQGWALMHEAAIEQRDKLAEELKEAQDAIGLMLKDSSCRAIPRYTKENLIIQTGEEL
jgi:hypothetical protein